MGELLKHNSAAPTQQNRRCDGRSVMDVVREKRSAEWNKRYQEEKSGARFLTEDAMFAAPRSRRSTQPSGDNQGDILFACELCLSMCFPKRMFMKYALLCISVQSQE